MYEFELQLFSTYPPLRLKDAVDEVESLHSTMRLHIGPELREANRFENG
jgi:hypothetical protein